MIETRLRKRREALNLSQTRLAYLAQVPACVISDCERGKRLPWPAARRALAEALGMPEAKLFPAEEEICERP
ncbi:MAG: helix-turn-helix domain-containing protein [Chloroflexota bacterium]|nr:MAG: helix-turn-helix domain-containing protein [Chloroflexota bacterium]